MLIKVSKFEACCLLLAANCIVRESELVLIKNYNNVFLVPWYKLSTGTPVGGLSIVDAR